MEKVDINQAHKELLDELYSDGMKPYDSPVTRTDYTEAMHKVQDKYELKQGHPQFIEWLFTCVGNSPMIIEDEKGAGENGTESE